MKTANSEVSWKNIQDPPNVFSKIPEPALPPLARTQSAATIGKAISATSTLRGIDKLQLCKSASKERPKLLVDIMEV